MGPVIMTLPVLRVAGPFLSKATLQPSIILFFTVARWGHLCKIWCAENNPGDDYTPNCNPRRGTPYVQCIPRR